MTFLPYGRQDIDDEDINAVIETLKSDYLTTGPKIQEFEQRIIEFTNSKYAVAVNNGTTALHLASVCLLNKGDKVLTTPNSFLATSNSILYTGSTPIFVDIKSDGNIDLDLCEAELEKDKSIKAIYAVHFSGKSVDQNKLRYLRAKYNLKILEDCSHSLGATFTDDLGNNIKAASCYNSDCSTLSFHPVKHLTTGEGGAVTTNDAEIYKKLLQLRNHGMTRNEGEFINQEMSHDINGNINPWYYEMQSLGFNYRLTDFQCALGISQFKKLPDFIDRRKEIAKIYDSSFNSNLIKPLYLNGSDSSYHLYVILIDFEKIGKTRAEFMKELSTNGIGSQVHYIPINKQPYYRELGYGDENTPNMDYYYKHCLSIPMYPSLNNDDLNKIISKIKYVAGI